VLLDPTPQGGARETQVPSRRRHIAPACAQSVGDARGLVSRRIAQGPHGRTAEVERGAQNRRDITSTRLHARTTYAQPFESIEKFAHIPGPRVPRETNPRIGHETGRGQAQPQAQRSEPGGHERVDVCYSLSQRRHLDLQYGEAKIEVGAEAPLAYLSHKVAIRRGYDPCPQAQRSAAPDPFETPVLQHPEQPCL
jgi:hypothetical protein